MLIFKLFMKTNFAPLHHLKEYINLNGDVTKKKKSSILKFVTISISALYTYANILASPYGCHDNSLVTRSLAFCLNDASKKLEENLVSKTP